ncbi:MAG: hypothetical protein H8E44_03455 [Planctomycetes bacterium]|nr:hypothetical protein [Planctomycetota bacterium]
MGSPSAYDSTFAANADFFDTFPEGEFYENIGVRVLPDELLVCEIDVPRDSSTALYKPPVISSCGA